MVFNVYSEYRVIKLITVPDAPITIWSDSAIGTIVLSLSSPDAKSTGKTFDMPLPRIRFGALTRFKLVEKVKAEMSDAFSKR